MKAPAREPTELEKSAVLRLPEMPVLRVTTARRRAEAFCDAPDYVLGIEVLPLTPRTHSMLRATENRFIMGGQLRECDVRNYIWFHSPLHVNCAVKGWQKRKRQALRILDFHLCQPWRKWVGLKQSPERYQAALALAVADIKALLADAFADAPPVGGQPGSPIATLEAHTIHHFATAYGWAPERTRNTPLRQIFQLYRCIRAGRGDDVRDTSEEELLFQHLKARNDMLAQARAEGKS